MAYALEDPGVQAPPRPRAGPALAARAQAAEGPAGEALTVEVTSARRYAALGREWADLVRRAAEPNPFMGPAIVSAALGESAAEDAPVLLAWRGGRLDGVWAFRRARARSGWPVRVLASPVHIVLPNGTPVVDRDSPDEALAAMLDAVRAHAALPKGLSLDLMNDGGPVMAALTRVLGARRGPLVVLGRSLRPRLEGGVDAKAHLERALSGGRRRKLGQLRRRLGGRGRLDLSVHTGESAVTGALERFMQLEAAGWKGSYGGSLLTSGFRDFARTAIPALAAVGEAEVWDLALDGAPVSMAVILRHGAGVYDWKIAYDERHRDCSPGVLLALDYTTAFLSDPSVAFGDSCAADDTGLLGPLWTDRQGLASLIVDATPGGRLGFAAWALAERWYRTGRARAKGPVQALRRHLARLRRRAAPESRQPAAEEDGRSA